MHILNFETRSRFCFLQSRSSRQEREFFSLNLRVRDEIENFVHLISGFETRSRISVFDLEIRDEIEIFQ